MSQAIDVTDLIGQSRLGRFQIGILILCGFCLIMDGFDVQAMGYVAPAVVQDLKIDKGALGPVFGAGLFGMLIGSLAFSALADRIGRRPVLIGATFFFAAFTLATATAQSLEGFLVLRFITGLGLGGIMPNAMALVGEYSPKSARVTLMMLTSCGFTVGAVLGGFVTAAIIQRFGWPAVFVIGGIVPLVIGTAMSLALPESCQFLLARGDDAARQARVRGWLMRIAPGRVIDPAMRLTVGERANPRGSILSLFAERRAPITLMLWVINFMNLLDLYFLSNWIPTLVKSAGFDLQAAVIAGTVLQIGGTVGTIIMGRLIDRRGFGPILVPVFALAGVGILTVGHATGSFLGLSLVIGVVGFCIIGAQPAVNALAATFYPTALRSTGVGWSLGIGRFGSVLGPVLGGELIRLNWPVESVFAVVAIPALVSSAVTLMIHLRGRGGAVTVTAGG